MEVISKQQKLKNGEHSIKLGVHEIEVRISMGVRMVKHSDVKELLELKDSEISKSFIDAGFIADTLFRKVYIDKNATIEQNIVFKGLCLVGIYALIDEVLEIDLRKVSYNEEFKNLKLK